MLVPLLLASHVKRWLALEQLLALILADNPGDFQGAHRGKVAKAGSNSVSKASGFHLPP